MGETLDSIFGDGTSKRLHAGQLDKITLEAIRKYTNPDNKPSGHFTGRCMACHSNYLWDDAAAYGCNFCDGFYTTAHLDPKIVPNAGHTLTPEQEKYNKLSEEEAKRSQGRWNS